MASNSLIRRGTLDEERRLQEDIDAQEFDRLFKRDSPAKPTVTGVGSDTPPAKDNLGTLGFADTEKPPANFTELFLNRVQIGDPPGQVDFQDVQKAGNIGGVQEGERLKTPGLREINDVLSAILGQTTGTQRARPEPEEMADWQKGLLFVSDIVAAFGGRQMPSSQLNTERWRALSLEDQQNRERYLKGIQATNDFVDMIGRLPASERARAAIQQAPRMRQTFGEGFGANMILLASEPSRLEAFKAYRANQKVYAGGASDGFMKYLTYLAGAGEMDELDRALSVHGFGSAGNPGIFEREALYRAPSLLEAKMDGFLAELRDRGGDDAEFASRVERGDPITPAELVNRNESLAVNSPNRFDGSVVMALNSNPALFAAELPSMVTAKQQQEYQDLLNRSEKSAPVNFIGGNESDSPGRIVTRPGLSQAAIDLQNNGYQSLDSAMTKLGGGKNTPSDSVIRGFGNDFIKESENFIKLDNSFNVILASSREDNAPGHVSMIFAFMKMLDPTSVVRENEQLTAENARSVPDAIRTWHNRALTGQKLTTTQVEQFLAVAEGVWSEAAHGQAAREGRWRKKMDTWKVPHDLVIQDLIGANRARFDTKIATDEDVSRVQEELGEGATAADVRNALIKDGFTFQ